MLVILNGGAGSATEAARQEIQELFAARGVQCRILQPDENRDLSTLAREAAQTESLVIAGGGDGTISAVAAEVVAAGKTLGVLPLGTLNHFAKDLGIPLDLRKAVDTIVEGHAMPVDVGEVNGRIFINNSSLGIYPDIVVDREAQQKRLARGKWPSFFRATVFAMRRFPFLHLKISVEGQDLLRRTVFLFVGNNEYEIAGYHLGARTCLNRGNLGLYLSQRTGRWGILRFALLALIGRLNDARDFDSFCVQEATIETRQSHLLVATDGEVTRMATPLHYRVRPQALRVLVPRNPC